MTSTVALFVRRASAAVASSLWPNTPSSDSAAASVPGTVHEFREVDGHATFLPQLRRRLFDQLPRRILPGVPADLENEVLIWHAESLRDVLDALGEAAVKERESVDQFQFVCTLQARGL